MSELRIGVMGAGSVGCYVGAHLLGAQSADVTLVGRERTQGEIARFGLHARGVEGDVSVPAEGVRYETDPAALADHDVVLLSVKSAQTAEVGEQLRGIVRADTSIVSLQNGLRNPETLRDVMPEHEIVPAIVGFNVVSTGAGVFHSGMSGPLMVERRDGETFARLEAALRATKLPIQVMDDIAPEQWTKLLVNLNNAISALSSAPTRDLLLTPGYRKLVASVVEEGLGVLRAAGIAPARLRGVPVGWMPTVLRLPTPLVRLVTRAQMKVDPKARSSMWEDLTKGRLTEVDYLNGEIVRLAERTDVDAPLNRRIVELVHEAERSRAGSPRLSPDDLWAAMHAA